MICPSCGYANEDGESFCEKCKADLQMPAPSPLPAPQGPTMNDSVTAPIPLEPIDLEPIALEPVPQDEPIPLEPVAEEPKAFGVETVTANKPSGDTTGEQPALPPAAFEPLSTTPTPGTGKPKLIVLRGQRMDAVYPVYAGKNYIGRTDDKPVDIDLEDQEATDRIWASRQHAVITLENGHLSIEDLNSLNGTFVNRNRVHPGQVKELRENDVIQVGTVHMKVVMG